MWTGARCPLLLFEPSFPPPQSRGAAQLTLWGCGRAHGTPTGGSSRWALSPFLSLSIVFPAAAADMAWFPHVLCGAGCGGSRTCLSWKTGQTHRTRETPWNRPGELGPQGDKRQDPVCPDSDTVQRRKSGRPEMGAAARPTVHRVRVFQKVDPLLQTNQLFYLIFKLCFYFYFF